MSINTMIDVAIKNNIVNQETIKKTFEISESELTAKSSVNFNTSLSSLFLYIPTEILTLYVAVLAAIGPVEIDYKAQWITFFVFITITPIVVWITYAGKTFNTGELPIKFNQWPKWEMFAATIAFASWSFALPQTPFNIFTAWYSPTLSGVVILVTSSILGLISPFFTVKTNT